MLEEKNTNLFMFRRKKFLLIDRKIYCTKWKKFTEILLFYNGQPWTYPTFRKMAAAAAADVKNVQEFVAENEDRDVVGQHAIDVAPVK